MYRLFLLHFANGRFVGAVSSVGAVLCGRRPDVVVSGCAW
jgi:hypothetical protein